MAIFFLQKGLVVDGVKELLRGVNISISLLHSCFQQMERLSPKWKSPTTQGCCRFTDTSSGTVGQSLILPIQFLSFLAWWSLHIIKELGIRDWIELLSFASRSNWIEGWSHTRKTIMCVMWLPVEAPMAPMSIAGIAMNMHPKEAFRDNIRAFPGVLHDNTRWKYTCHGRPPQIWTGKTKHQNEIYEQPKRQRACKPEEWENGRRFFRCHHHGLRSNIWRWWKIRNEAYQQHSIVQPHSNLCSRYLSNPFAGIFGDAAHCFMSHGEWNTEPLVSEVERLKLKNWKMSAERTEKNSMMQKYISE